MNSKEDYLICGLCQTVFKHLPLFINHKQVCVGRNEETVELSQGINSSNVPPSINEAVERIDKYPNVTKTVHEVIECEICKKTFNKVKQLLVHLKSHNGKHYQCQICGRCFGRNSHLVRHELSHKVWPVSLSETTAKNINVDASCYCCNYCDMVLSNYSQYRVHLKKHLSLKKYKCQQVDCTHLFETMEQLLIHVSESHKNPLYVCHICGRTYSSLDKISVHQQDICESKLTTTPGYKCSHCDAYFKKKEKLTLHLFTENHNKSCVYCSKKFASDKRLRLHLQIHKKTKPFVCNICNQSFLLKKYLTTHLLKHGEKLFSCKVCQHKFKRHDMLVRHMRLHQKRKKEICPFKEVLGCNMEFTRRDKLNLHVKHHTKQMSVSTTKTKMKKKAPSTLQILIVPFDD